MFQHLKASLLQIADNLLGGFQIRKTIAQLDLLLATYVSGIVGIVEIGDTPIEPGKVATGFDHSEGFLEGFHPIGGMLDGLNVEGSIEGVIFYLDMMEIGFQIRAEVAQSLLGSEGFAALDLVVVVVDSHYVRLRESGYIFIYDRIR